MTTTAQLLKMHGKVKEFLFYWYLQPSLENLKGLSVIKIKVQKQSDNAPRLPSFALCCVVTCMLKSVHFAQTLRAQHILSEFTSIDSEMYLKYTFFQTHHFYSLFVYKHNDLLCTTILMHYNSSDLCYKNMIAVLPDTNGSYIQYSRSIQPVRCTQG